MSADQSAGTVTVSVAVAAGALVCSGKPLRSADPEDRFAAAEALGEWADLPEPEVWLGPASRKRIEVTEKLEDD